MKGCRQIERRIFVVGVPRSGTTLVQSLLAAHDGVASSTESHFFDRHFRLVPGLPSRAVLVRDPDVEVCSFLQANEELWQDGDPIRWLDEPPPRRQRLPMPWPPQADATARRLLGILDDLALCQGRTTWVEKTPAHLRYVPFLDRLLRDDSADLRFVHVIRDGLATVASLVKASRYWQRAYGVRECVRRWNRGVALSLARVDSARDSFVVYEDLIADPEAASRRLFGEMGLPWRPEILERQAAAYASVTAPQEAPWKGKAGRAIGPPDGSADAPSEELTEMMTERQREQVRRALRHDLYDRLRERARA